MYRYPSVLELRFRTPCLHTPAFLQYILIPCASFRSSPTSCLCLPRSPIAFLPPRTAPPDLSASVPTCCTGLITATFRKNNYYYLLKFPFLHAVSLSPSTPLPLLGFINPLRVDGRLLSCFAAHQYTFYDCKLSIPVLGKLLNDKDTKSKILLEHT